MEFVSKPNTTAAVREHFGFKPNDCGETLTCVSRYAKFVVKQIATKSGNPIDLLRWVQCSPRKPCPMVDTPFTEPEARIQWLFRDGLVFDDMITQLCMYVVLCFR